MPTSPFQMQIRELDRRKRDIIKVTNPTNEDFTCYWNSDPWKVRAGETRNLVRYIATQFAEKLIDSILTKQSDEAVRAENEKRVKKGMAEMTPDREQPKFEFKYRINDPDLRKPIFQKIWGGVVEYYGKDETDLPMGDLKPKDTRTMEEQWADDFEGIPSEEPVKNSVTSEVEE